MLTGNEDPTKPDSSVDWAQLAAFDGTIVIFMAARKVADICRALVAHGKVAKTPAAVVEWGTWPDQRTVAADLAQLPDQASTAKLRSPALIIVGDVVALRRELNWFENKALFGRRLLITRSREQAGPLQRRLENEGADVSVLPLLDISPPDDWRDVDAAQDELARCAWVVFTSPNAVAFFCDRLFARGRDARAFAATRIAAVGLATTAALRERGLMPDLVPEIQSQEGLEEAFATVAVADCEILFPTSSIGRTHLVDALQKRGARVRHLTAYQNRPPTAVEIPAALADNALDLAVFASPSSLHNFHQLFGPQRSAEIFARTHIACIGPTTAGAARDLGFDVQIQPAESSIPALVEAICAFYASQ